MSLFSFLGLSSGDALAPGAKAPAVTAHDHEGKPFSFAEFYRRGWAFVYFYPKADTPGCTAQACSLRDAFTELSDEGLAVVGVSIDSPAAQKRFKEKHRLPFPLIADEDGAVAKAFGVPTLLGLAAKRQAYLIHDGVIAWADHSASTKQQADDVRRALAKARKGK